MVEKNKYLLIILFLTSLSFYNIYGIEPSWIDLPQDPIKYFDKKNKLLIKLKNLIDTYHSIQKTDFEKAESRIYLLSKIINFIETHLLKNLNNDEYLVRILNSLLNISKSKKLYLEKIRDFYQNYDDSYETVRDDIIAQALSTNKNEKTDFKAATFLGKSTKSFLIKDDSYHYKFLILNNGKLYIPSMKVSIGKFWLEVIDPCHRRYLLEYREKWERLKIKDRPKFFFWMEDKVIPWYSSKTFYPTNEEIQKIFTPVIINKKFYSKYPFDPSVENSKVVIRKQCLTQKYYLFQTRKDSKDGHIFVINPDKKIRIALGSQCIRHTSLSRGMPIIGIGSLWFENGRIYRISFSSGHYFPSFIHYKQVLDIFEEYGVILSNNTEVIYYDGPKYKTCTYSKFRKILTAKLRKK
ncbi:MAG: hypothetical protein GY830_00440 [Bacteroidetes bacterium]|nr:hypothetical protein [Bacteroidota bacterium]